MGSLENHFNEYLICETVMFGLKRNTVKLKEHDSSWKNEEEKDIIYRFHNESEYMKGILIERKDWV